VRGALMTTLLKNLLNRELQELPNKIAHHIDDEDLTHKAANQLVSYLTTLDPQLDQSIIID